MSDLSREQCRAGRALIDWSQTDLAERASISRQTIVDFERGARQPHPDNLSAMRRALEAGGIEFIDENGGGAGVRLKRRKVNK